jgi:beta-lactamase class A
MIAMVAFVFSILLTFDHAIPMESLGRAGIFGCRVVNIPVRQRTILVRLMPSEVQLKRRTLIFSGGAVLLVRSMQMGRSARAAPNTTLAEIEAQLGGRIGVAAVDTGSGTRLTHRGSERFAMCSTFKWLLAAAVLAKVEEGGMRLDQRLSFAPKDLLAHSPVTTSHVVEGALSIEALCEAAVEVSDNTAANTLLKVIGGPEALTGYLRRIGDRATRLDRFELSLNTNLPGDPRDTTTPDAMIATMQKVLVGDALSTGSRDMLIDWLKNCETGLDRIRAGLPPTWAVGDKTGTGENGAANDIAIIWPPRRSPLLVAAFCNSPRATPDALNAAHARIGSIVAAAFS